MTAHQVIMLICLVVGMFFVLAFVLLCVILAALMFIDWLIPGPGHRKQRVRS